MTCQKPSKSIKTELHVLLGYARDIWRRNKEKFITHQRLYIYHLLWALMLMNVYSNERTICTLAVGVDKKIFRTWTWTFIAAISTLESYVVS